MVLWCLVSVTVAGLLVRMALMLINGANQDFSSNHHLTNLVYTITGLVANRFQSAAEIQLPLNGVPHLLDLAALLAIDVLFFGTLMITKVALWGARRYAGRQQSTLDSANVRASVNETSPPLAEPIAEPVAVGSDAPLD